MTNIMISFALVLIGTLAQAQQLQLGNPAYGGTGCPSGTASAVLSPDNQSLSIIFDAYQVAASRVSGKSFDRKSCNLAIPVTIPQGYSLAIYSVDYRGFNHLPDGANSEFDVEYFFAGYRGPNFRHPFWGTLDDNYVISHEIPVAALVWSACGARTTLRANTSMRVSSYGDDALSTVDSADVNAALIYHLEWKRCF